MRQLAHQVCYARYQVSFYLRWFRRKLISEKWKNIMTRIVWKLSFTLYTSNDDSNFWKKYQFWLENVSSFKKTTNRGSSKFSKVKFWPKPRIKNSANTKPSNLELLTQLICFIFLTWLEKCFEATEIFQKSKREGDWAKLRQKICLLRQSWAKYLAQSKEIQ